MHAHVLGQISVCREHIGFHGCLAKAGKKSSRWTWKRHWVWLLHDRLCYTPIANTGELIQYVSLDRITVRPLPRGYKPCVGVQHVHASMTALPEADIGGAMPDKSEGRVFSVQYGARTVYWAAGTSQEAKAWMQAITHAWVAAVLNPDRHLRCCEALLQLDASEWEGVSCTSGQDREDSQRPMSTTASQEGAQESLCDVEVHTREAKGWAADAKPWIALHGVHPDDLSGRHLLFPVDGALCAFSSAAVATCQIRVPAGLTRNIEAAELGLYGDCRLWAPEKVCIRFNGQPSWTVFPCDSILSSCWPGSS